MKSKSPLAFIDFLFILLLSFISMYILALILINPIAKKSEIEHKAEYLIIVEWDENSTDDVDIWVRDPHKKILSFRNMNMAGMHLDRDDVGVMNDSIRMPDGTFKEIKINRELVTFRSWVAGEYIINLHMYNMRDNVDREVRITFLRLNPYKMVFEEKIILKKQGAEHTVARVTIKENGGILSINQLPFKFIARDLFSEYPTHGPPNPNFNGGMPNQPPAASDPPATGVIQ